MGKMEAAEVGKLPDTESAGNAELRIRELEDQLAVKDEALRKAEAEIIKMRQAHTGMETEVAHLKEVGAESEEKLRVMSGALAEAVIRYREVVLNSNPGVVAELVSGDTIAAIDESLERAKVLVSQVRQSLEAEIAASRVPLGAPVRTPLDLSSLSARQKISYAIGHPS